MMNNETVAALTDRWIDAVVNHNNPALVASLFCPDGNLVGTVSTRIRTGDAIRQYFEFFALLPGIRVLKADYMISQVTNDVFVNTAFVTWAWVGQDPVVARMTFLFRGDCIFQLHSSVLPEVNEGLQAVSVRMARRPTCARLLHRTC